MRCAVLADRHHGLREAIRGLLEGIFDVIVMVTDEPSLMAAVERMQADVALVDLSVSEHSGLHMLHRLRTRFPHATLIAMSGSSEPRLICAASKAGADAFVSKMAIATELIPMIEALAPSRQDARTERENDGC